MWSISPCCENITMQWHEWWYPTSHLQNSHPLEAIIYASSAWWGFANAADRQRIEAFVRRGVRSGFYSADSPTVLSDSDDNLFQKVLNNQNHVLHKLLPEQSTHDYYLRPRSHDQSLSVKTDNNNFLSRLLFKLKTCISYCKFISSL